MKLRKSFRLFFVSIFLMGGLRANEPAGFIAQGTPWETPYHIIDSGVEGPIVLVVGGIHGDQPAGFRAAEQIRRWPISKGKLIVIPAANLRGLKEKRRSIPGVAEAERDLNRNFAISETGAVEPQGKLAESIWELVGKEKPDWFIDFHEGTNFHVSHQPAKGKRRSSGSTIIYSENEEIAPLAEGALADVSATISDPKKVRDPHRRIRSRRPCTDGCGKTRVEIDRSSHHFGRPDAFATHPSATDRGEFNTQRH